MRLYLGGAPCCDAFALHDGLRGPTEYRRLCSIASTRRNLHGLPAIEVHVIHGWQMALGFSSVFALTGFWSWLLYHEEIGNIKIVERCETELPDWDFPRREFTAKNSYRKDDGWEEYDRQQRIARQRYEGEFPRNQKPTRLHQSKLERR